jgi:hypothetical protein
LEKANHCRVEGSVECAAVEPWAVGANCRHPNSERFTASRQEGEVAGPRNNAVVDRSPQGGAERFLVERVRLMTINRWSPELHWDLDARETGRVESETESWSCSDDRADAWIGPPSPWRRP